MAETTSIATIFTPEAPPTSNNNPRTSSARPKSSRKSARVSSKDATSRNSTGNSILQIDPNEPIPSLNLNKRSSTNDWAAKDGGITLAPPHPTITSYKHGVPWWMANKISPVTITQNVHLQQLLLMLNTRDGGRDKSDGQKDSGNFDEDLVWINKQGNIFEKNFNDIQRLLDKAKNTESHGNSNGPAEVPVIERKKKEIEATETQLLPDNNSPNEPPKGNPNIGMMRKPLRLIMKELEKKIDLLRSNPIEWEAFQAKIAAYREEDLRDRPKKSTSTINTKKEILNGVVPLKNKIEHLQKMKVENEAHRKRVYENNKAIRSSIQRQKMEAIQKKEETSEAKKIREKKEKTDNKNELKQKRWFVVVALASRMYQWKLLLDNYHVALAAHRIKNHKAHVIQNAWRKYKERQLMKKKENALILISTVFKRYVLARREEQKHKASNIIRQFFIDVHDVSKIMKIIKKYIFSVIRAEKISKSWLAVKNARIICIGHYWDSLLNTWWTQRKVNAKEEATKGKKPGATKKSTKKDEEKSTLIKVQEAVKMQLIKEDYETRRKQYRKSLNEYAEKCLKKSMALMIKKPTEKDGENVLPVWKMLPAQADMLKMMEKGFQMQVASQAK